ncbi:GNAT family N-acetyltransferase [Dactylosporangium sp. CS-047395]|uniref:GNAT family N-acetyltransferase n=1 Tax=Dactylosporangium sp. CS-047395 TaxID=3239936 RepID=UPI003D8CEB6B
MTIPSTGLTVRKAGEHEAPNVARLIAEAFAPLDVSGWLVAQDDRRVGVLTDYFTVHVGHAFRHGQVDVIDVSAGGGPVLAAAGVWFAVPHPDVDRYEAQMLAVCGEWAPRFTALEAQMHRAHPLDRGPHMYLAFLAVGARWQNRGLGSLLLDARLRDLDQYGLPSYLEASNAQSRNLYLRKGFMDCAPVLDLPYDGEPLYPMWRDGR